MTNNLTWCDECRMIFLPDPHRGKRSFEAGMKRLDELKKKAIPDDETYTAAEEIFGHIPPAPRVKAEELDF